MDKSSSLGMPTHSKKYPRGISVKAWGCPRGTPSSSPKVRSPFNTLYFYCFMHYMFFLERLVFSFQFCLVFFCNKWLDPNKFLLEKLPCFSFAKNTLFFTLIVQRVFSFSVTTFSFRFSPWFLFRSCYIFISSCIMTSGPCWFSSKELLQKSSNGVGKEKNLYAKSGTKRSLCRLRPRLLHVVLDVFLIVCLVVLL
jgi:hypothetical protein